MTFPGANIFVSPDDVTTPPRADGNRTIMCQPINASHRAGLAWKGMRILWRIMEGIGPA